MEAVRRVLGTGLLIIVSVFLLYGFFAPYLPGVFEGSEVSAHQLFNYLYLDPSSMMSMLNLAATVGLIFILFGQVLLYFGGADILNNIALAVFGRFRGGSAKGSILGSSLVGSITGNPVANVILTGSVTIPLMKKNGFSSTHAGAVEAVSSTGGQIMPPVMGIAAFIIAETLGVPYAAVALAAVVPAIMYYFCLFLQVDFIAGRENMQRLGKENIPAFRNVIKSGWLMIPTLGSLIYFLFFKGYTPQASGVYASVVAVVFLSFQKTIRKIIWNNIVKSFSGILVGAGKMTLEVTIILAAAGLVMGITGITGLGFNIGLILAGFAEYGLLVLLIMSAVICIILGMGMPSVAAYALVAVLVAPALVELGVDPLAAHLFVFYFAIVSNFTPPVAVCCFAAAPLANGNPHKIGFYSMRLGLVAYLVPFLFVYAPEMLIRSNTLVPWTVTILTITTALIACYLMAMAVEGFLFQRLSVVKRIITAVIAACLFLPYSIWEYSWIINSMAFFASVLFVLYEWVVNKRRKNHSFKMTV